MQLIIVPMLFFMRDKFIELKNFTNDGFETTQNIFKYNSSLQDETIQ
jgi:hypothetical protein